MRIVFARHGQTPSNIAGALDTEVPGADLTDTGREQARKLADVLRAASIDSVHVSTLARTQQTAAPYAEMSGLPVVVDERLREVVAGDLEMRTDDASKVQYIDTILLWCDGDSEAVGLPGGDSRESFLGRFDDAVASICASGSSVALVVSHGAALRCWIAARTVNISSDHVRTHPLANTGVVIVEGTPRDGWRAVSWEESILDEVAPVGGDTEGDAAEITP